MIANDGLFCGLRMEEWRSLANYVQNTTRVLGGMNTGDDIVQEMMIAGWKASMSHDPSRGTLKQRVIYCALRTARRKMRSDAQKGIAFICRGDDDYANLLGRYSVFRHAGGDESKNQYSIENMVAMKLDSSVVAKNPFQKKLYDLLFEHRDFERVVDELNGKNLDEETKEKRVGYYKSIARQMRRKREDMKKKSDKKAVAKGKKSAVKKAPDSSEQPVSKYVTEEVAFETLSVVDIKEVDNKTITKYLKEYGLSASGTLRNKVTELIWYFVRVINDIDVLQCTKCDGHSDASLPECPYCGEKGEDDADIFEEVIFDDSDDSAVETSESEDIVIEESIDESDNGVVDDDLKQLDIFDRSEVSKQAKLTQSEIKLNEEVERFKKSKDEVASGLYDTGMALKNIKEMNLWKHRRGEKGEQVYTSFKKFAVEELDISYVTAIKLVKVVSGYDRPTFEKHGLYRCNIALELPSDIREKEIESEKSGSLIKKDLEDLKDYGKAKSKKGINSDREEDEFDSEPDGIIDDEPEGVTVVFFSGMQTYEMQARPTGPGKVGGTTKPATSLDEDPWFKVIMANDAFLHVRIVKNQDGFLQAVVEARRGTEV